MKELKDMVVGICNDHAGVEVKNYIIEQLGDMSDPRPDRNI